MEQENRDSLMKSRSGRACIRDGYRFYVSNFRSVFRSMWILAAVYAILTTAIALLPIHADPALLIPSMALQALVIIGFLFAAYFRLRHSGLFLRVGKESRRMAWLRHPGMVLLVVITSLIVVCALSMFTMLPDIIITLANWQSQMGVLNGDPAGMPSSTLWLTVTVLLLSSFLQAFIWLSVLFPVYLMRGSIAQQEKERKDYNNRVL